MAETVLSATESARVQLTKSLRHVPVDGGYSSLGV